LIFDWTALEAAAKVHERYAPAAGAKPAIMVGLSEKAESEIPANR
jgi:hypothetical protein